ncbi:MAG: Fur family transcriptional regulator [Woeseiaceae bacterium]|nr:Fur family transcriptional regulator [Woeseiaceae bacterium]
MTREDILDLFAERGVKVTPQRLEVAAILLEKPQHLSADQIIDRLRGSGSRVSKATVYNTLNLFGERGIAREVKVDPIRRIYDSTRGHHYHFFNVDTGELQDIPADDLELGRQPDLPEGTEPLGVDIVIRVKNRRN